MTQRMRIAIIGTGISGLMAAHRLHAMHDLTIFEARDHVGGHTHTVDVDSEHGQLGIDTGFIVYNEPHYPHFAAMLRDLNVASQPTRMSFSVRCDRSGLEYNTDSLMGVFAQRRNLLRPGHWRMLRDIHRFHRDAHQLLTSDDANVCVDEYLLREHYGSDFAEAFLIPMGTALWSCPPGAFRRFPMRFVVEFLRNHRMLQSFGRPEWRVIKGGSRRYVEAMTQGFRDCIRLRTPVRRVQRTHEHVRVHSSVGPEVFDHVIFACHSDQALALLADADRLESETLAAFPYQANEVVLHTDTRLLPRNRRAWAAWNAHVPGSNLKSHVRATVTYNMNILQSLACRETYCVTLNESDAIDPARVLGRFTYHHPMYDQRREAAWRNHDALACRRRTSYCGAYWGYGFHEDGVRSALKVCDAIACRKNKICNGSPDASIRMPQEAR